MTLRTSCSKTAMLRKTVSRFWPLWAAYLAILLLVLPMGLSTDLQYDSTISIADVQRYVYEAAQFSAVFAFFMAPVTAMCVFSHLYNDRHTGAYASLPVKRENMFLSCALAGLIPQLLAGLTATLAVLGVEASYGAVDLLSAVTFLGVFCLHTITFYGFAVLCAQMTGAILVVPAVYIVLQFTAVVVEAMVQGLTELFLYGYTYSSLDISFLSPFMYILNNTSRQVTAHELLADGSQRIAAYGFSGWGVCALYAVTGLVFLAVSFFLYRKRRMETSGDFVACKPLKPVFKWALGAGCGLILSALLLSMFHSDRTDTVLGMSTTLAALIFLLAGGFVGFFGAEMLMKKTFRVFDGKAWKGFGIFAAVILLLLSSLTFDFFGYEKRIPDLEDIESVRLYTRGDDAVLRDTANIESVIHIHEGAVSTQKENKEAYKNNWDDMDYTNHHFTITYFLKNGKTLERAYNLCGTGAMQDVLNEVEDVMNGEEAIFTRVPDPEKLTEEWFYHSTIHYNVETKPLSQMEGEYAPAFESNSLSLSAREAYDLYVNCIIPDMRECTIGTVWMTEKSPYFNKQYEGSIEFEILLNPDGAEDEYSRDRSYYYFIPTVKSERTNAWLEEHGITMLLQDYINKVYEEADRLNRDLPPTSEAVEVIVSHNEATSIGIIGGADGPTAVFVAE